jgi:hypothetical protein
LTVPVAGVEDQRAAVVFDVARDRYGPEALAGPARTPGLPVPAGLASLAAPSPRGGSIAWSTGGRIALGSVGAAGG